MTTEEYRSILEAICLGQSGPRSIAALLRVDGSSIRKRLAGIARIAPAEQIVLRLMADGRLTYDEAVKLVD